MKRTPLLLFLVLASISYGQTLVNTAVATDPGTFQTSITTNTSFAATTGNAIIVIFSLYNATTPPPQPTITDTAGNTYSFITSQLLDNAARINMYYAKNITGHAANFVTATFSSAQSLMLNVLEYSGLDKASPYNNVFDASSIAFSSSLTSGTFTTSSPNELIVFGARAAAGTYSAGSGYTIRLTDPSGFQVVEDRVATVTGGTATISGTVPAAWQGVLATFKAQTTSIGPQIKIRSE